MSTYLIGDVHGCIDELKALLAQVDFNPQNDCLWLTGDLVARGPSSLEVLRFVSGRIMEARWRSIPLAFSAAPKHMAQMIR